MSQDLVKFTMEPKTLDEAMKFADLIAKSDLIPKDYIGKPGNILIAIQWGQEVGLKPMQALQNIAVINGRPAMWGDAPLSLVQSSGKLADFREDFDDRAFVATCQAKRKGQPSPITRTFSRADAEKAGLWDRNTWKFYPKRMCQLRARAFVLRDGFSDVLKGMAIAEEQQDVIDAEVKPAEALEAPPAGPKRLSQNGGSLMPDETQGWIDVLLKAESMEKLAAEWTRLAPASKDGFYHRQSPDVQAQLLAAKNQRKQELEAAGSKVEFPAD